MTTNGAAGPYGEQLAAGLLESPAAERNKQPILEVLERTLPARGVVLEIASGTGQHVLHFARALPGLEWQPSVPDAALRPTIERRLALHPMPNVRPPLALDVRDEPWPIERADALLCINMIHIAPWSAAIALFRGARARLPQNAPLVLYGPYRQGGRHTAPSNAAFDESLRARNLEWGVRDLAEVTGLAEEHGFTPVEVAAMPANNLTVVFVREG